MIVKAGGRFCLLAAALLVLCVSPVQAETTTAAPAASDNASSAPTVLHKRFRYISHHRYLRHKSHPIAAKSETEKPDRQTTVTVANAATDDSKTLPDISPSVANANAQLLLAGVHLNAISAIPSGNDAQATSSDNPTLLAAADQLNDADRSLREGVQAAEPAANSQTVPAAANTMTSEASLWKQTSLIGKIFIGFGTLLTMASAARMFMA